MAFFKFRKGTEAAAAMPQESIETLRRRAKHRLLGATVLVLVAVVGFPILFETQPRPVAVDIPIDIPDKNKVKPLVMPAAPATAPSPRPVASGVIETAPKLASQASVSPVPRAAAPDADGTKNKVVPAAASVGAKEEIVPDTAVPKTDSKPLAPKVASPSDTITPSPEPKEPGKAGADEGRFVVQVGAFAEADRVREVRQKLERAGLKTYAQVIETKDGKRTRVRVGPFTSRGQAEQVAEKIKAIDLPAAVLVL